MDYQKIVDQISTQFYKNYKYKDNLKAYTLQSKIFTSALLLFILENSFAFSNEQLKEIKLGLSINIDNELLSEPDLDVANNIKMAFGWMSISRHVGYLNQINISAQEGSLESSEYELYNLLYSNYIQPLTRGMDDDYFFRFPFEYGKFKKIFFNDYIKLHNLILLYLTEEIKN